MGPITDYLEFRLRPPYAEHFSTYERTIDPPITEVTGADERLVTLDADPDGTQKVRMATVVAVGKSAFANLLDEGIDIDREDACPAAVVRELGGDLRVRLLPEGFGEVTPARLVSNPAAIRGERGVGVAFTQEPEQIEAGLGVYLINDERLHLLGGAAGVEVIAVGDISYMPRVNLRLM